MYKFWSVNADSAEAILMVVAITCVGWMVFWFGYEVRQLLKRNRKEGP